MRHQISPGCKKKMTIPDPIFGLAIPQSCPGVPSDILTPRNTWKDQAAYDAKARELAAMSEKNFAENAADAPVEIKKPALRETSCRASVRLWLRKQRIGGSRAG